MERVAKAPLRPEESVAAAQSLLDRFGYISLSCLDSHKDREIIHDVQCFDYPVVVIGASTFEEHREQAAFLGFSITPDECGPYFYRVTAE